MSRFSFIGLYIAKEYKEEYISYENIYFWLLDLSFKDELIHFSVSISQEDIEEEGGIQPKDSDEFCEFPIYKSLLTTFGILA